MSQEAPLTLPEAHVTAAQVQARAINTLTFVLALGGLVSLHHLASLYNETLLSPEVTCYALQPAPRMLGCPKANAHMLAITLAQVVLLAILYESHAWRQTVWHVVDEAVVVESKVWVLLDHCSPLVLLT